MQFKEKKFDIPKLKGISEKNIEEHLKLYAGYVKSVNLINQKLYELWMDDPEKNKYVMDELTRRFSFEYNGMRNHEVYFGSLSGGAKPLADGELKSAIEKNYKSVDILVSILKKTATTRGVGWAMLWYDREQRGLIHSWVDEQHLGQLQNCAPILGIDMWEHAFVYDYATSEKAKYIDAFFENLNWEAIERNFIEASKV